MSSHASSGHNRSGGDKEIRTLDPLLARQVLSQLSYTPRFVVYSYEWFGFFGFLTAVFTIFEFSIEKCIKFGSFCLEILKNLRFFKLFSAKLS